jgi:hypothetical protein
MQTTAITATTPSSDWSPLAAIRLMQSVITQALVDAVGTLPARRDKHGSATNYLGALRDRDDARSWLTGNSRDFRKIADLVELNPDDIRERALKLEAEGWPRRVGGCGGASDDVET